MIIYRYLGGGFLPGIPARDLTERDLARVTDEGALVASGLYEPTQPDRRHTERQDELDLAAGDPAPQEE